MTAPKRKPVYRRISATFWTGETGKKLRQRGFEAVSVAQFLMTAPEANMIGMYHQPVTFIGYYTALGTEGAAKGLQACKDVGFCDYDADAEVVWIREMAKWQIEEQLNPADLRCKGIQREYDSVPKNQFLGDFFDRYSQAFHMSARRSVPDSNGQKGLFGIESGEAPSKPGTGTGTEAEKRSIVPSGLVASGDHLTLVSSKPKPTKRLPACPYELVFKAYHEQLPDLPKVRLTDDVKRKAAIAKLWKWIFTSPKSDGQPRAATLDEGVKWVCGYFSHASQNDFIMGRTQRAAGHEGWRADFDFLLSDKGLKQVIEKTRAAS